MKIAQASYLIKSDLYRYTGAWGKGIFLRNLLVNPGFKYTFWMRMCAFVAGGKFLKLWALPIGTIVLRHYSYKYGISIPYQTKIGSGLQIGHFGGIVVNEHSTIGRNCNLSHDVTLGKANRGRNQGYPTIGDNVYIGPGAKIVGGVKIGDYAAVGANAVVTSDVADHEVVGGVPAKTISHEGSAGYVDRVDYDGVV